MTNSTIALWLAIGLYLYQSMSYYILVIPRYGMALAFLGYAIGNVGFIIDIYEQNGGLK